MGKFRTVIISAAAVVCPLLAAYSSEAGAVISEAAAISAGKPLAAAVFQAAPNADEQASDSSPESTQPSPEASTQPDYTEPTFSEQAPNEPADSDVLSTEPPPAEPNAPEIDPAEAAQASFSGTLITRNITTAPDDGAVLSGRGGRIIREFYGKSAAPDYITLENGAQVRNCTSLPNEELLAAADELPDIAIAQNCAAPQVLIVHTHTTESYEQTQAEEYDSAVPSRSRNAERNMTAVGEALARELSARGISVLHDGTVHDYPVYTGAYDRSEQTVLAAKADYPEIKIIIDLHRDAIENPDGTRVAPTTEINGKSAAQFMIITGCDDGRFGNMPQYMENFKLACLIQKTAEELYPGLSRAVLFDYRNYNQHLSTGSLLIEIGSHASSLDEAEYTAQLLGEIIAKAAQELSES